MAQMNAVAVLTKFHQMRKEVGQRNDVSLEIERKITLNGQILYKKLILPVLLYCAGTWTLLSTDAAALRIFKRKVLRKIFGETGI